jgi:predicted pyridoxine 5'-phosphate oxidase superfamily flavin-nucleotide-binding protein
LTTAADYTHCPNCLAEYGAWSTICLDCGSVLVPGPSPVPEVEPGRVEVMGLAEDAASGSLDRFALEEEPVVLTSMIEEDVDAFLAALDGEEIGARRGERTDDGGVGIIVHAANLMDAQAVLVEFTGDVALVDEIAVDPDEDRAESEMAVVTWIRVRDVGAQASRLREAGLDVRIELPDQAERASPAALAAILVPVEELDRAREILGIEL